MSIPSTEFPSKKMQKKSHYNLRIRSEIARLHAMSKFYREMQNTFNRLYVLLHILINIRYINEE